MKLISIENQFARHALFWMTWIFGFTFVKSFGGSASDYLAWFVYYLVTLPVFIAHTYIIVYWAAKRLLKGVKIIVFIVLFISFMMIFSCIELLITGEILSKLFPVVFSSGESVLTFGNIAISGVGNLYILVVFVAVKMMRRWYIADSMKRSLASRELAAERADANAGIQPGMLIYSVTAIEQMARIGSPDVPDAIVKLSELLNGVMLAHKEGQITVQEEIRNLQRMLGLYSMIKYRNLPVVVRLPGDYNAGSIWPCMLFNPVEALVRHYDWIPGSLFIHISNVDQSIISWDRESALVSPDQEIICKEIGNLYPDRFRVELSDSKMEIYNAEAVIGL